MTVRSGQERFEEHIREWHVIVEAVRETETSLIAYGTRRAQRVVLKVARRESEEWRSGGHDLSIHSTSGKDDQATEVIAEIIGRMMSVRPVLGGIKPVRDFVPEFEKYRHTCAHLMPAHIIDRAERIFSDLCDSQSEIRVLHGDLHHYNVLCDSRQGWVAIDPWGLQAEIEYEVGASLRNPIGATDLLARHETVLRRLGIYEQRLGFKAERALVWAFSQTVLGALWPVEEGVGTQMRAAFIAAATTMMSLLG